MNEQSISSEETSSQDCLLSGEAMHLLASRLFPLHRSQTGDGVRETLHILSEEIPLSTIEIPSGTKVFDWEIPQEWSIRDAAITAHDGTRVVDYRVSNLHVVNGSQPICATMNWKDLEPHIYVIEDQPTVIPYRTCFFRDSWGFCVNHAQREQLRNGEAWHVMIDSGYSDGSLSLGECHLRGQREKTVLFHCHTCHPSLANDNLSGIVVAHALAKYLQRIRHRYSYRFVFAPATIGAIAWLASQTHEQINQIEHGLVLTCLGDPAPLTFKLTRRENALTDRLVQEGLRQCGVDFRIRSFEPSGYDERQYGSPGFNLPVGRLSRGVHGEFPEYHTSRDNLQFIRPESLAESLRALISVVKMYEANRYPINRKPYGEPRLGRYGIYREFGQREHGGSFQQAMIWILNLADGIHDMLSIAQRSGLDFSLVAEVAEVLSGYDLIYFEDSPGTEIDPPPSPITLL